MALGPEWIKSSLSYANGNCVEMKELSDGAVLVRNSRHPDGPVLKFTAAEWADFIAGARNGEFNLPQDSAAGSSPAAASP
jgi:Domain of unknown function (DUF397)